MEGITDGWNLNFPLYVLIEIRVFKILYPEPGKTKRVVEMKKIRFFCLQSGGRLGESEDAIRSFVPWEILASLNFESQLQIVYTVQSE